MAICNYQAYSSFYLWRGVCFTKQLRRFSLCMYKENILLNCLVNTPLVNLMICMDRKILMITDDTICPY